MKQWNQKPFFLFLFRFEFVSMAEEKPKEDPPSDSEEQEKITLLRNLTDKFSRLLSAAKAEEAAPDPVLKTFDLAGAAEHLRNASNIIVMAGAGISTSAGIPDFRSPGTGLYSQLQKYDLPYPEAVFHLDFFRENPKPFFLLAKELYPQKFTPTPTHYFLRLLNEKNKILRIFTQNIDSLERVAGIPPEKIVEAHGTFFNSHCLKCRKEYDLEFMKEIIFKDEIPYCLDCKGVVKPDIVFFGEGLPPRFRECLQSDFPKADFLIIIGTSLKVAPFNLLINYVEKDCPRLLINREPVGQSASSLGDVFSSGLLFGQKKNRRDVFHENTCDDGVMELAKLLGWEEDFKELMAAESFVPKENTPAMMSEMAENADRLAEQIAKATLENKEEKTD